MASIREKGPHQWQVQIRRKGCPLQNATFRTKKDAQAWGAQDRVRNGPWPVRRPERRPAKRRSAI
jgi:hypothetical protein